MPLKNYLNHLIISFFMSKRITIVLGDATNKKVRRIQSKLISELTYSISFSKVAEILMLAGLENLNVEKLIKELQK